MGKWDADAENRIADASNFVGWTESGGVSESEKAFGEDGILLGDAGEFGCRDRIRLDAQQGGRGGGQYRESFCRFGCGERPDEFAECGDDFIRAQFGIQQKVLESNAEWLRVVGGEFDRFIERVTGSEYGGGGFDFRSEIAGSTCKPVQDHARGTGDGEIVRSQARETEFLVFERGGPERFAEHGIDTQTLGNQPHEGGYPAAMPVSFIAGTGHLGVYRRNRVV